MGNPVNFYSMGSGNKVIYYPISGKFNDGDLSQEDIDYLTTAEDNIAQAAYNFTVTDMVVKLKDAPGGSASRTFTLRKNSTDTDFSITLNSGDTIGSVSGSVSYSTAHFDTISLKEKEFNNPTTTQYSVALNVVAESSRQVIITGQRIPYRGINAFYYPILNNVSLTWITNRIPFPTAEQGQWYQSLMATNGTLTNYRQLVASAQTAVGGEQYFYSFNDGSTQILTFKTTGEVYLESTFAESISGGNMRSFYANRNGAGVFSTGGGYQTIDFYPTNSTERIYDCGLGVIITTGVGTSYCSPVGSNQNFQQATDLSEEPFIVCPIAGTIKNLYVNGHTATTPTGFPITVTMRKNFSDTSLTTTLTNPNTSASETTASFSVVAGDLISIAATVGTSTASPSLPKIRAGWVYDTGFDNVTPIFFSNWGVSATTVVGDGVPINFYSRPDTQPINFYSLP